MEHVLIRTNWTARRKPPPNRKPRSQVQNARNTVPSTESPGGHRRLIVIGEPQDQSRRILLLVLLPPHYYKRQGWMIDGPHVQRGDKRFINLSRTIPEPGASTATDKRDSSPSPIPPPPLSSGLRNKGEMGMRKGR